MRLSCVFFLSVVLAGWAGMVGRGLAAESSRPQPVLVKNICDVRVEVGLFPEVQVAVEGRVFMTGEDVAHGRELWISDGTTPGTWMVKDICPGTESSGITQIIAAGSRVFFLARDGVHGQELWVSDGTETGTRMVKDLKEGLAASTQIEQLAALGEGVIFRTVSRSPAETKLWYSDGTEAGTRVLTENSVDEYNRQRWQTLGAGDTASAYAFLQTGRAQPPNGEVSVSPGLWKTDGTGAGTVCLAEVPAEECWMVGRVGGTVYFLAWSGSPYTVTLWKSDGTAAGTVPVKPVAQATHISASTTSMLGMVIVQGRGYFALKTVSESGWISSLWETDGTEEGTRRLEQLPDAGGQGRYSHEFLRSMGGRLVAGTLALPSPWPGQVWVYDPAAQTGEVVWDGRSYPGQDKIDQLVCTEDQIFFLTGQLWASDGTAAGTRMLTSGIHAGSHGFDLSSMVATGTEVFFQAERADQDAELWKSDGTLEGTLPLTNIEVPDKGSLPRRFFSHAGLTYFAAGDGVHGRELWRTDGSAAGTWMVKDIAPDSADSSPRDMVDAGGLVYFRSHIGENQGIWRTNGTAEGTVGIAGFGSTPSAELTAVGSRVFFTAVSRLWRSDGDGARIVSDYFRYPESLVALDGWLYFVGTDQVWNQGLFRVNAGPPNASPEPIGGEGYSFMVARPPVPGAVVMPDKHVLYLARGHQLWRCCNGEDPVLVHAFANTSHVIEKLLVQGDQVLMEVPAHPNPLWRSNGTSAGTATLIVPAGKARFLRAVGETIYFQYLTLTDKPDGLYAMNRDGAGVKVLVEPNKRYFIPMHAEGKTLFLARCDDGLLWTLWRTEGTPETTAQVSPLPLGINPPTATVLNTPVAAVSADHRMYFPASSGLYGDELHAMDLNGRLEVVELEGPQNSEGRVLASGDAVSFPQERVGHQAEVRRLRVRNTGYRSLTDLSLSLPEDADFTASLITRTPGEILPGDFGHVEISFSPKAGGARSNTLQILATGNEALTHVVNLTGTGFGLDQAPELRVSPVSRLALLDEALTLTPEIYTAAAFTSLVWKKDGMAMPAEVGTGLIYTKNGLQPADAGVYTLTATTDAGSVTTAPAAVGMLSPSPGASTGTEGGALQLAAYGTAPIGYKLEYVWRRNGQPLTDTKVLKGSRSAVLKISRAELTDEGAYDCWVTLATSAGPVMVEGVPVNRSTDEVQVTLLRRPRVQVPAEPLSWMIGETVSYQIKADWHATSFTAKGLPPGLKMSKTGLITGKPTRSLNSDATGAFLPYPVSVTATNNIGLGPAAILPIEIRAFMPAGGYDCLLDWMPSQSHGSQAKFTVTSAGAFSGQLLHCGKTYRFTSSQLKPVQGSGTGMDYHTNLGTTGSPLLLTLHAPEAEGPPWAVTLEHGGLAAVRADCRRHLFSSAQPATAFVGAFTWSLQAGEVADVPEGAGFMTATVAKTGTVNWKGKLADGTAVTGSNALSSFGSGHPTELPVHVDLYKLKGALHGAAAFMPGESSQVVVGGRFVWSKGYVYPVPKNRIYIDGFPRHEVAIEGSRYQAPGTGEYLFGIEESGVNAQAILSGPRLDLDLTQDFALNVKHSATLTAPTLSNGFFLKSLTFSAKTGTFKGSVMLLHATDPKLNRTAAFEGVIQSRDQVARGFVLLPELPVEDEPVSAIKTSPLKSVLVKVGTLPRG